METDKKIKLDTPNLLTANSKSVKQAIKTGIHQALLKHKQANNPVAIWRDGKVVLLPPDEILPDKK